MTDATPVGANAEELRRLERALSYADGSELVVLVAPTPRDVDAALNELAGSERLRKRGRHFLRFPFHADVELREVAVFIGVLNESASAADAMAVIDCTFALRADQERLTKLFEALNEKRNDLLGTRRAPLVICIAPWQEGLLAQTAPDLWSVRGVVVHLQPRPVELLEAFSRQEWAPMEPPTEEEAALTQESDSLRKAGDKTRLADKLELLGLMRLQRHAANEAVDSLREVVAIRLEQWQTEASSRDRVSLARVLELLAAALQKVDRLEESLLAASEALVLRRQQFEDNRARRSDRLALVEAELSAATVAIAVGRRSLAKQCLDNVTKLLEGVEGDDADYLRARANDVSAAWFSADDNLTLARERYERSAEGFRALLQRHPTMPDLRRELVEVLLEKAGIDFQMARFDDARLASDEAVEHLRQFVAWAPDDIPMRGLLVAAIDMLGRIDMVRGDFSAAEKSYREALECVQENKERFPLDAFLARKQAMRLVRLGAAVARQGRIDEGITHLQTGLRILGELGDEPWDPERIEASIAIADVLTRSERIDEAIDVFEEAARHVQVDMATDAAIHMTSIRRRQSELLLYRGRLPEALEAAEMSVSYARRWCDDSQSGIPAHFALAAAMFQRARVVESTGEREAAMVEYRSALAELDSLVARIPGPTPWQQLRGVAGVELERLLKTSEETTSSASPNSRPADS